MKRLTMLLLSIILLVACSGTAPTGEVDTMAFAYLGTGRLPTGFDAQGHRGARGLLPENSLPAFEAALDLGVTTLELDLHYTADGHVVIWHDPVIDRAKCRLPDDVAVDAPDPRNPLRRVFISQQPLEIIQAYRCDLNPEPDRFPDQQPHTMPLAGDDYRIITLAELFDFVDAYAASDLKSDAQRANATAVHFNIETKRVPEHPEYIDDGFTGAEAGPFEVAILEVVRAHALTERVIIQSFDHRSLQAIRAVDGDVRLAALTRTDETPKPRVYAAYGFNIWSPNQRALTTELIAAAQNEGLAVIPYTVNDPESMDRLIAWGVDGLISDRPDLLLDRPTR